MKYLKSLAAAFLVALFTLPAVAQSFVFPSDYVTQTMFASRMVVTAPATTETFNFGIQSRYVGICAPAQTTIETRYIRMGHTLAATTSTAVADTTRMTIVADTANRFLNGIVGTGSTEDGQGKAVPFVGSDDGKKLHCQLFPWRTRGITIYSSAVAGTATVPTDVWVFPPSD